MSRGLRLFGHPAHAALVHAPMGLLAAAPLWDVLGAVRAEPTFFAIAFWSTALGVASALLAAVAGFVDLASLEGGSPAEKIALRHMTVMLVAVSLSGATLVFRGPGGAPSGAALVATLCCGTAGLVALLLGGFLGGELVFRHGIGQVPPPS